MTCPDFPRDRKGLAVPLILTRGCCLPSPGARRDPQRRALPWRHALRGGGGALRQEAEGGPRRSGSRPRAHWPRRHAHGLQGHRERRRLRGWGPA